MDFKKMISGSVSAVSSKTAKLVSKAKLKTIKNSPEILVVVGVVGVVASTVMACKATLKAGEVLSETEANLDAIRECTEKPELAEKYTDSDRKKDLATVYIQTGVKLCKLYGPSVVIGTLSVGCILMSNHILRKRNAALAAAYTAMDQSFKTYRKRVIEKFGDDVDKEMRYGIKAKQIEEKTVDENGNEVVEKRTVYTTDDGNQVFASPYARFFDELSTEWTREAEYNLMFLRTQQAYANDKLKAQGYLFLNDVYEALGIPKTKAGQIVGWTYGLGNTEGDNFVDFGIYDIQNPGSREFVNGYEKSILLDFNVDGNILDLI